MGIRWGIRHIGVTTVAAGLLVGCASDSLTLPSEGEPAFLVIVHGNGQQGRAGRMLPESLVVSVTDGESRPVVSRSIGFTPGGGGSVDPATAMTNGEGKAVFRWVLGPTAGEQLLEASLSGGSQVAPRVTFTATAIPGPVQTIAAMSGDGQVAPVGTPLPQPLVVQLLDSFGNGVSGATVRWQASSGRMNQSTGVTGVDGAASVVWTLGQSAGIQTASASFQGAAGSPISFTATATPGASPRLVMMTEPSSSTESGEVLDRQPAVRIETAQGQAVSTSGIGVTAAIASGGGTLTGTTTVTTNSSGVARFTDLVITGSNGGRTLIFAAPNYTPAVSAPIQVTVTAAGPSAQKTTAKVPGGKPLRWTTITITTRDGSGNLLNRGGYASLIKVAVSGANTNSSLTVFDQGDGTYEASYFPIFKGTDNIAITLGGTPIQGSPYQSKIK
jgi:hypothetical protein